MQLRRNYRDFSSQVDPAREIELEVIHISVKTDFKHSYDV